tara:strand:- start:264 stop:542 length:279 start_codon:yes stop_codon:yes gene_type:complete
MLLTALLATARTRSPQNAKNLTLVNLRPYNLSGSIDNKDTADAGAFQMETFNALRVFAACARNLRVASNSTFSYTPNAAQQLATSFSTSRTA